MQLTSEFDYSEMMEIGRSIIIQTDELLLSKPPLKITDIFKITIVPKKSPLKVSDPIITCEGSEVNEIIVRAGDPPTTVDVKVDLNKVFKEANIIQKVLFQSRSMAYDNIGFVSVFTR